MKSITFLFLLIPFFALAQNNVTRNKTSIYKSVPTYPYEDLNRSGTIVVIKSMYGLKFENDQVSEETKKVVKSFFKLRLNQYSKLKKYHLKVEKLKDGIYINRYLVKL
ncbi:hypothetical protein [Tenacibaculum maritimum]|uniref:hypothetical protein n=1 Tax=Tenacibaculum maritimum TaxID=107401 RepID=UPI0038760B38